MSYPARYAVTFGLEGCYMPDCNDGAFEFRSAREFSAFIKGELENYDMPKRLFREVNFRDLWRFIQSRGSSCAHFSLCHKGYSLSFYGLTEDEYREYDRSDY